MVHTIYKTTNLINGKYYIGVHKTDNPHDDYLGSGKLILAAVAKYGEINFQKEILFEFDNGPEAFRKEEELVEQNRDNKLCYNLRKGGAGGFDYMNRNGFSALGGKRSGPTRMRKRAEDPIYRERQDAISRRCIAIARKFISYETTIRNQKKAIEAWRGSSHSEEYKARKRLELLGHKNPTKGKFWISLGGSEKIINPEEVVWHLEQGWLRGRQKRYWVAPFVELAIPRKFRAGRPTQGIARASRKKPRAQWLRKLPVWPSDEVLVAIVGKIGERAVSRSIGCSHVAVNSRLKKIRGGQILESQGSMK